MLGVAPLPSWERSNSPILKDWLSKTKPDIILLMLGTNDYFQKTAPQLPETMTKILDNIYDNNPKAVVVISTITPFGWNKTGSSQRKYNQFIREETARRKSQNQSIIFVDMYKAVGFDGLGKDNLHLNKIGNERMAIQWLDALNIILNNRANRSR